MYFANCHEGAVVSFDATVQMYNVGANGRKNYLSVGELELPKVYLVRCFWSCHLYSLLLVFTFGLCSA